MQNVKDPKLKILIVDDSQSCINILTEILGKTYDVAFATNGSKALQILTEFTPDLIMLDIMMPIMDGYDFIKYVRADPEYKDIYIMMLSNKSESEDIVKGLELGANHYITKPFDPIEIDAWVKTLIRMKNTEDQLKNSISILEHDAAFGVHTAGFSHDLNHILNNMECYEAIEFDLSNIEKNVDQKTKDNIKRYIDRIRNTCDDIRDSITLGKSICSNVMSYEKSCLSVTQYWDLKEIIKIPLNIYQRHIESNDIKLLLDFKDTPPILCKNCDIQRVIMNLMANAIYAMRDTLKKELTIQLFEKDNTWVALSIHDTGHGISSENQSKIFERFFTTKEKSAGIGLDTVNNIVKSHDGTILVNSKENWGSTFTILFPIPSRYRRLV
jgi:DNA-binding response OmpR family regulator/two-component sensor histidine kinase